MPDTRHILQDLVDTCRCKPGWEFSIRMDQETGGPCFVVLVHCQDSSRPDERRPMAVSHWFPVPLANYGRRAWRRWMFEMCRGVECHELGEWFRDGAERPFSPLHGPGELPYVVHEFRPEADHLTTQDGSLRQPYPTDKDQGPIRINFLHSVWASSITEVVEYHPGGDESWVGVTTKDGNHFQTELRSKADVDHDELLALLRRACPQAEFRTMP